MRNLPKAMYVAAFGMGAIAFVSATFFFNSYDLRKPEKTPVSVLAALNAPVESHKYRDGTYAAVGTYGSNKVDVILTLVHDTIVDERFAGHATNTIAKDMQLRFAKGISAMVVGKQIDDVAIEVVNGSSKTGIGFMDAVEQIKVQALQ